MTTVESSRQQIWVHIAWLPHQYGPEVRAIFGVVRMFDSLRRVPGLPINIDRTPFSARLLLWGRAVDGWWGLVTFAQAVREGGKLSTLAVAAWLPAKSIKRPGWAVEGVEQIERIALAYDRAKWAGSCRMARLVRRRNSSGPLATPDGVEIVKGPAWRRRR